MGQCPRRLSGVVFGKLPAREERDEREKRKGRRKREREKTVVVYERKKENGGSL